MTNSASGTGSRADVVSSTGKLDVAVWHSSFAPDTVYAVNIVEGQVATADFSLDDIRGPYIENVTEPDATENIFVRG